MKKIHFMGVLGSGMAGISDLASKMGYKVTGCDLESTGHSTSHLKGVDLLVVTPAVFWQSKVESELLQAKKRKIVMTWQEFLGKILLKGKKVIAVAGTHGKSTTTAMISKILIDNGFDPICLVGAKIPEWRGNSRFGKGEYAVIEADEFNDNFLNYSPEIAVITNIEFDHPDYFINEAQVKQSFDKFIKRLTGPKILITEKDSLGIRFNLRVVGEHNQRNANMAYLVGKKLGIKIENIISSLESYGGVGRRMELLGKSARGLIIYDDYAHHPTAIKATIDALRDKYNKERIWVVVEAHGYARTKALLAKYKGVFDSANFVVIGPIFRARDAETFGITPDSIVKASGHKNAFSFEVLDDMYKFLREKLQKNDVVLVMGAGKSNIWARNILKI